MNRERAKELLPVIQAFAEGKTVQFRNPAEDSIWRDDIGNMSILDFDDTSYQYRIKPEPRIVHYTAEELIPFIGEKFRHKSTGSVRILHGVDMDSDMPIELGIGCTSLEYFHANYEHYDGPGPGRPIGKVVD